MRSPYTTGIFTTNYSRCFSVDERFPAAAFNFSTLYVR